MSYHRYCGGTASVVLFKTEAALRLIQRCIPLFADLTDKESVGSVFEPRMRGSNQFQRTSSTAAADAKAKPASLHHQMLQREFTSWKALRLMIAEHVFHQVRNSNSLQRVPDASYGLQLWYYNLLIILNHPTLAWTNWIQNNLHREYIYLSSYTSSSFPN